MFGKEVVAMSEPTEQTPAFTVVIVEKLRAKHFIVPTEETVFLPGDTLYSARKAESSNGVPWILVLGEKEYGWPFRAIDGLIELDRLRLYDVDGYELASTLGL
mgnify:CR=1 FL=1